MIRHICMFTLKDDKKEKILDEYQKCQQHLEFGEFLSHIKVNRACIDYEI